MHMTNKLNKWLSRSRKILCPQAVVIIYKIPYVAIMKRKSHSEKLFIYFKTIRTNKSTIDLSAAMLEPSA